MMHGNCIQEIIVKRDLIGQLIAKELKVRYSRPMLGSLWAFLSPLFVVLVFYVIFSLFLNVRIEETPYMLYLMSAVFPWRFFSESLCASTTSLVDNKHLLRESNMPQYFIPLSICLANLVSFLPSLAVLLIASAAILKGLPVFIIFLPLVIVIHVLMTVGLSVILSVMYVRWRDIKYILDPVLQMLFYLIPGVYSLHYVKGALSPKFFTVYSYNPLAGMASLYRISALRGAYQWIRPDMSVAALVYIPVIFSVALFMSGMYFYRINRSRINDNLSY